MAPQNGVSSLSWFALAVLIFVFTTAGYYTNPEAHAGFLFYVVIFEVLVASFCLFAGLCLVPKQTWLMLRNKFRNKKDIDGNKS